MALSARRGRSSNSLGANSIDRSVVHNASRAPGVSGMLLPSAVISPGSSICYSPSPLHFQHDYFSLQITSLDNSPLHSPSITHTLTNNLSNTSLDRLSPAKPWDIPSVSVRVAQTSTSLIPSHHLPSNIQNQLSLSRQSTPEPPYSSRNSPTNSLPLRTIPRLNYSPLQIHLPAGGTSIYDNMQVEQAPSPHTASLAPEAALSASYASKSRVHSGSKLSTLPGGSIRSYHSNLGQQQIALQKQQRELILQATRIAGVMGGPTSPRLIPLGSPGPVTPFTLEDCNGGYILASSTNPPAPLQFQKHHLEKLAAAARELEEENGLAGL